MKKDFWADALVIGGFILFCAGVLFLMFYGGSEKGYTDGYCAALGGTVLNPSECNVDGRVVEVKR